jgi:hypothetical protein
MIGRTAGRIFAVVVLGLSLSGTAFGDRGRGGGHFAGHGFRGGGFHSRVFIGGAFIAPFYYPPSYYYPPPPYYAPPEQYMDPYAAPSVPQSSNWFYCPASGSYYPYVQQCPGGWQQVAPHPPS